MLDWSLPFQLKRYTSRNLNMGYLDEESSSMFYWLVLCCLLLLFDCYQTIDIKIRSVETEEFLTVGVHKSIEVTMVFY